MKHRWFLAFASVAVSAQAAGMLAACATEGETATPPKEETNVAVPSPQADGGESDAADADAAPCEDDCEYFPAACTDDALCSGGMFNPADPASGLDQRTRVTAITGRSPSDIWLTGTVAAVGHFDGTAWKRSVLDNDSQYSLAGIWLLGNAEVAFDDPRRLYTRGLDAGADAAVSTDGWSFFGAATVPAQWGTSEMRIDATYAFPGAPSLWIGVTTTGANGGLWRMRYSAETNQFAVTAMTLGKCSVLPCREIYGLHGLSADEIWAVGPRGAALRFTNAESDAPTIAAFNTFTVNALESVWAAAPNDVWAVGSTGTVRRYRGDPRLWEIYDALPTKQHLRAVAGSSPNDIWITGDEGTVFHFDGTDWKRVKIAGLGGGRPRLNQIWIPSPGKVWIGGPGVLLSLGGKP